MNAPDKIWVTTSELTVLLAEKRNDYDVAYIRKDALLEWAKEKAEDYKGTANIRRSFEMMIRKIESL